MAKWYSCSLKDIIDKVEEKKFCIPVVQRDLVWGEQKMSLIFDTLLRGDSFGGIMTIEDQKGKDPLFAYREFIKDYVEVHGNLSITDKLSQNIQYVIDGQQRLSAFYIGIRGTYKHKKLYFNVLSDYKNKNFNFKFESEQKDLPKEVDKIDSEDKTESLWIAVSDLYSGIIDTGNDYKEYFDSRDDLNKHTQQETIRGNLEIFQQQVITSENIGIAKVQANRKKNEEDTRNEIVELFRRLNQGGTRLNVLDLMASKLKGFNADNEKFLYDVQSDEKFKTAGFEQDEILKLIFLLQGDADKGIANISKEDSNFIQDNKDRIKETVHLLSEYPKLKKLSIPIIPKYFIVYHLYYKENNKNYFKNLDTSNNDFKLLDKWLKVSLLNSYIFSRSGAGWQGDKTGIRKILEVMKNNKNKTFPYQQIIDVYKNHPLYLFKEKIDEQNINNMDRSFIFDLLYLEEEGIKTRKNDFDHIHPQSKLNQYHWNLINDIGNFQLLDYSTNRGNKNDKEFCEWINDTNCVQDKKIFIKKHFIPEDENLWKIENFENFLNARKKLIIEKVNEMFNE